MKTVLKVLAVIIFSFLLINGEPPKKQAHAQAVPVVKPVEKQVIITPTPSVTPTPEPIKQVPKPVVYPTDHVELMTAAGISPSDFGAVEYIISRESGWRHLVWNGSGSGAYGLCQALPASKMASAGADYMTNPVTQLKWCNAYAQSRYGGWWSAYSFWTKNHWW